MALELVDIVKTYGNVVANNHVSLRLNDGEILAIVGENGAGKSTIMKILYGMERPDSGQILVDGSPARFHSPLDAMKNGIGMLQQHFMLFESMSVMENILYNHEEKSGKIFFDKKKGLQKVRELSAKYGLAVDPERRVSDCPVGIQQRVEILKILHQNPDTIIFDEPSAVLTPLEVKDLLQTIKNLAKMGKNIILITHKLNEVMEVADRVVVMRQGVVVGERMKKDTSVEELSYMMIGRQVAKYVIPSQENQEVLLDIKGLTVGGEGKKNAVNNVSLHVKRGEIVGIAGVSGNGQHDLVQALFGMRKAKAGSVRVGGAEIANRSVRSVRAAGVSLIPDDRYGVGSARTATLAENTLMGKETTPEFSGKGFLNWKRIGEYTQQLIEKFSVKADNTQQGIAELSGGNAQKLIVAREMSMDSDLLIAYEPTRGVDIGAIEFIHQKFIEKRNNMDGILLVSSELSEIISLSDRIYVIHEGEINGEFERGHVDEVELGRRMLGGNKL